MNLINGEYDKVARASLNPERLRKAHAIPCSKAKAIFLTAILWKSHGEQIRKNKYCKFQNMKIKFRSGHTARGWGGYKRNGRPFISLPSNPGTGSGKLRIGLVLHEFAHMLVTDHSTTFTLVLDSLCKETEAYWNIEV